MKTQQQRLLESGGIAGAMLLVATFLTGCDSRAEQLYLPSGDAAAGLAAFEMLGCPSCHAIAEHTIERPFPDQRIYVVLGGPQTRVTTYSELVSSVVNPSHKLSRGDDPRTVTPQGKSLMPSYNEQMTVQQLIDIVEFLKPTYYVWTPDTISYEFPEH